MLWIFVHFLFSGGFQSVTPSFNEKGDYDERYPKFIPKYSVRKDSYSNEAISRGKIELLGGIGSEFSFRMSPEQRREKNIETKRVPLSAFKRLLQCAPIEPDLDGNRGSISLMNMLPPSSETVKFLCAKIESGCETISSCRKKVQELMIEKKYSKQFGPGSWLGLLRVIKDDVFLDWPWGRERLHPGPFQSMTSLLFHVLDRAYGFPDSVFIMGSEYSNLAWNIPFPAFTNSPSFKKADLPWPWLEAFTTELNLHRKVISDAANGPRKFNSSQYHNAFATQVPWNEKINKALYRASILDIRQIIYDQALQRPDLIDALWLGDALETWNPESTEDPAEILANKSRWMEMGEKVIVTNNSVGLMEPLLKLYRNSTVKTNPSAFKYLVVGTGMTGILGVYALSGRLASFLAHSGSVVLLQHSEFSYHFSSRLQPWVHYVPLSYSAADLVAKVQWLQAHDEMAQRIAKNARAFGDSYLRLEDSLCFMATALETVGNITSKRDANTPFDPIPLVQPNYF